MPAFNRKNLTDEESWNTLKQLHIKYGKNLTLRNCFADDNERFAKYRFI